MCWFYFRFFCFGVLSKIKICLWMLNLQGLFLLELLWGLAFMEIKEILWKFMLLFGGHTIIHNQIHTNLLLQITGVTGLWEENKWFPTTLILNLSHNASFTKNILFAWCYYYLEKSVLSWIPVKTELLSLSYSMF